MSLTLGTTSASDDRHADNWGDFMNAECTAEERRTRAFGRRETVLNFSGGTISSDGGAILLAATEQRITLLDRLLAGFTDYRSQKLVEHPLRDLLAQRIFGIALGNEDLNDHDELSKDPLIATIIGKRQPTGAARRREQDRDRPLASSSTLNRLELTPECATSDSRYKKIVYHKEVIEQLFLDVFLDSYSEPPDEIVLDFDHTDDQLHGDQEGSFFHAYYKHHIYLPLYVFCDQQLLVAQLRTANGDAMRGVLDEMKRVVAAIRERWPEVRILLRGDSAFTREETMAWCEGEGQVDYLFGLAKNSRLLARIELERLIAYVLHLTTGEAQRVFKDFDYRTRDSWSRARRVVAKAEHLPKGANPRFVVTNLPREDSPTQGGVAARALYEEIYCARGECENRIKEQQLCLFADRTSAHSIRANQLRLWFSSLAYVLLSALRRLGLEDTEAASYRCDTIRLKLLKIGARVRVTARRVWIELSSAFPRKGLLLEVLDKLMPQLE